MQRECGATIVPMLPPAHCRRIHGNGASLVPMLQFNCAAACNVAAPACLVVLPPPAFLILLRVLSRVPSFADCYVAHVKAHLYLAALPLSR